jgi:putative ABC transport system permease protein
MRLGESFKIAVYSIISNKMRSFLTMLGIIIGIASVIAILSLGEGGRQYIISTFESIGSTTIDVRVSGEDVTSSDYFTLADIEYVKERVANIKYATPTEQRRGSISLGTTTKTTIISAGSQDLGRIQDLKFTEGRFFTEGEYEDSRAVVVIDENGAMNLFGRVSDIVGEHVVLGAGSAKKSVTVVGVTESVNPLAGSSNFGDNIPAFAYVPYGLLTNMGVGDGIINSFYVSSTAKENTEEVAREVVSILNARKNAQDRDIYQANSFLRTLDQVDNIIGLFTSFISAVAAISLLVGGIGVMNIMLVSVTERTREIGIRKAIGATTTNIMVQFLTESVILALIGGILGMVVGISGALIGGDQIGVTPVLSVGQIIGVILFSSAIGIFFGIYPARKAALMDPIDALRYE